MKLDLVGEKLENVVFSGDKKASVSFDIRDITLQSVYGPVDIALDSKSKGLRFDSHY